jgi:hypothetical protein
VDVDPLHGAGAGCRQVVEALAGEHHPDPGDLVGSSAQHTPDHARRNENHETDQRQPHPRRCHLQPVLDPFRRRDGTGASGGTWLVGDRIVDRQGLG